MRNGHSVRRNAESNKICCSAFLKTFTINQLHIVYFLLFIIIIIFSFYYVCIVLVLKNKKKTRFKLNRDASVPGTMLC